MEFATLTEALNGAARFFPEQGIGIYDRRGQNAERRTYPQIVEFAADRAGKLAAAGVRPGDRVLCALPTSWDLLETFFGAVKLGASPVLVAPPPALGNPALYVAKIAHLVELLAPSLLICDGALREQVSGGHVTALTSAQLAATTPAAFKAPVAACEGIAFMQLTSGSTGKQRAVQVTHASAIHNTRAISDFTDAKPGGIVVSWLPLNHDMGLVGCLLFSLVHGLDFWLLRPETFLARPAVWLKTIGSRRASFAPAPNFAWQLCAERIDAADLAGVDLSSLRSAVTGAEMIRPETCAAFVEKFGSLGFHPRQWQPCYGMAECTLAATSDRTRTGIRSRKIPERIETGSPALAAEIVCTGPPVLDTEVRISSAAAPGQFVPDGATGEVWVKGPGVFAGYFNNPQATAEALSNGWLRTGDLGFMEDGELYITGRLKDILIIHGENWMPHELEWEAEAVCGGGGAERSGAFSVDGPDGEKPVVVVECATGESRSIKELEHAIRSRIGQTLRLPLADVVVVKRGQIPKTTSGKVQRSELRRRYIEGKLERMI